MEPTPALIPDALPDGDAVVDRAVARAARWMSVAEHAGPGASAPTGAGSPACSRIPAGLPVTMALTDEVMRISDPSRAAATLQSAAGVQPTCPGRADHLGLSAVARISAVLAPDPAMRLVHWQVREASTGIILPAEQAPLRAHLAKRAAEGARLNINVLGEAVLGEDEATHRLDRVDRDAHAGPRSPTSR